MNEIEKTRNKHLDGRYEYIYIGNFIKYKWTKYPKKSLRLSYKENKQTKTPYVVYKRFTLNIRSQKD